MRNSNLALGACIVSYTITAVAYLVPSVHFLLRHEVQENRVDYSSIFEPFLSKPITTTKATSLVVISDPSVCPPCRKLEPVLNRLIGLGYNIQVMTPKEYRQSKGKEKISGIPTLIFYDRDQIQNIVQGYHDEEYIRSHLTLSTESLWT